MATLAGIGFTVSLLIGELAFEDDATMAGSVKAAVLTGSVLATVLATVLLKIRNAKYRKLAEEEERDEDLSGVPDVYEQDDPEYHLRMADILEKKAAEHRRSPGEGRRARRACTSAGRGRRSARRSGMI